MLRFVAGILVAEGRRQHLAGKFGDLVAAGQPPPEGGHPDGIRHEMLEEILWRPLVLRPFDIGDQLPDPLALDLIPRLRHGVSPRQMHRQCIATCSSIAKLQSGSTSHGKVVGGKVEIRPLIRNQKLLQAPGPPLPAMSGHNMKILLHLLCILSLSTIPVMTGTLSPAHATSSKASDHQAEKKTRQAQSVGGRGALRPQQKG